MPVDPAPYLSTVILTSAALVAIVGGLLVARFVTLDSDEQGSRRIWTDAAGRLATARERESETRRTRVRWFAWDFVTNSVVLDEISTGQVNLAELRRLVDCELPDDELEPVVHEVAGEFAAARSALGASGVNERIVASEYDWEKFRRLSRGLPEIRWPAPWERVFDEIASELAEAEESWVRQRRVAYGGQPAISDSLLDNPLVRQNLMAVNPRTDFGATLARRADEIVAADDRARQQVEDAEAELRRLQQAHAAIVRPDARLWWGVAILMAFTIAGVAVPLWVMSYGPTSLAQVRWIFYLFAGGLVALLAYIVSYLISLTRRHPVDPGCS